MINIIQHLWQFQTKNILILPTVIKIKNEPPKSYFYSEKQQRILRKKQYGVDMALTTLRQEKITEKEQFMLFKKDKKDKVQIKLNLQNQIRESLNEEQTQCEIVSLFGLSQILSLVQCQYNRNSSKFKVSYLIYQVGKDKVWKNSQKDVKQNISQLFKGKTYEIVKLLESKAKQQVKCLNLMFILKQKSLQSYLVWCNTLLFKNSSFYEIAYQPVPIGQILIKNDHIFQKSSNFVKNYPNNLISKPHTLQLKRQPAQFGSLPQKIVKIHEQTIEKSSHELHQCNACSSLYHRQSEHEIQNEKVIQLRRKYGLKIVGFLEEYYNVCQNCYNEQF